MSNQRRGPSIMFPIILISIGVLLLLSNMNILEFDVWNMITRYWPVIIIAMGIDLLLGRRVNFGHFLIIGLVILFAFGNRGNHIVFRNGGIITEKISVDLDGKEFADVTIDNGVGYLEISGMDDEDNLITGSVDIIKDSELDEDYFVDDETVYYSLGYGSYPFSVVNNDTLKWYLDINEDVPMDLTINTGVGESILYISDLQIQQLDVNMGVGYLEIYLPDEGEYDVSVEGGVGGLTIFIPDSLGVRLILNAGLGDFSIPAGFSKSGNVYMNDLYSETDNRVDLRIDAGVGELDIRELP